MAASAMAPIILWNKRKKKKLSFDEKWNKETLPDGRKIEWQISHKKSERN